MSAEVLCCCIAHPCNSCFVITPLHASCCSMLFRCLVLTFTLAWQGSKHICQCLTHTACCLYETVSTLPSELICLRVVTAALMFDHAKYICSYFSFVHQHSVSKQSIDTHISCYFAAKSGLLGQDWHRAVDTCSQACLQAFECMYYMRQDMCHT